MLIPDFKGVERDLATVAVARPHVIAHNIETVERLTPTVRDRRAAYRQSLRVLRYLKDRPEGLYTKSSIMVGLGETDEELFQTFQDLRAGGGRRADARASTSSRRSTTSAWRASFRRRTSPGTSKWRRGWDSCTSPRVLWSAAATARPSSS